MGLLKQVFLFLADELAKASGFFSRLGLLKQVMFILLMSRDGGCGVKKEKSTAGVSVLFEGVGCLRGSGGRGEAEVDDKVFAGFGLEGYGLGELVACTVAAYGEACLGKVFEEVVAVGIGFGGHVEAHKVDDGIFDCFAG